MINKKLILLSTLFLIVLSIGVTAKTVTDSIGFSQAVSQGFDQLLDVVRYIFRFIIVTSHYLVYYLLVLLFFVILSLLIYIPVIAQKYYKKNRAILDTILMVKKPIQ